jgi:hypothetical protein
VSLFGRKEIRYWKARAHLWEGNYYSAQEQARELIKCVQDLKLRTIRAEAQANMWREKAQQ